MFFSLVKRKFFFSRQEEIMQVNSLNQRIGKVPRTGITQDCFFRTANVYCFDKDGKLFVQKRAQNLKVYPGFYDAAPGGVVRINESDQEAAIREIMEEMGLQVDNLKKLATASIESKGWFWWCSYFRADAVGEPKTNEDVESIHLMSIKEIKDMIADGAIFTPSSIQGFKWLERKI
jgi:8-oxo-dGTP pyrophosphatase MutT (NUDIX family)